MIVVGKKNCKLRYLLFSICSAKSVLVEKRYRICRFCYNQFTFLVEITFYAKYFPLVRLNRDDFDRDYNSHSRFGPFPYLSKISFSCLTFIFHLLTVRNTQNIINNAYILSRFSSNFFLLCICPSTILFVDHN